MPLVMCTGGKIQEQRIIFGCPASSIDSDVKELQRKMKCIEFEVEMLVYLHRISPLRCTLQRLRRMEHGSGSCLGYLFAICKLHLCLRECLYPVVAGNENLIGKCGTNEATIRICSFYSSNLRQHNFQCTIRQ